MKRKDFKNFYRQPLPPGTKVLCYSPSKNEKNDNDKKYHLTSWGLPSQILSYYLKKGISRFFDWQVECLQLPGVIENQQNLVYSAPTSAGKSMVADMLLYKTVLERKKKAIIILPFVSITVEKVQSLKHLCRRLGVRIDSFAGNTNPRGGLARVDIAVCTMEKANNMINKLIENDKLDEIGIIIIDELHMIGDSSRGYILELLLSKIIFLKKLNKYSELNLQLIGMSATIPNLSDIAKWLDAQLYITDYRPVPLNEYIVLDRQILQIEYGEQHTNGYALNTARKINYDNIPSEAGDLQSLVYLTIETIVDGYSTLIFCRTKAQCESMAITISKTIYHIGKNENHELKEKIIKAVEYEKIVSLMKTLKQTPTGLDKNLESSIRFGCGFHHAGLTMEERAAIEQAFRDGTLRVLCCTSTLSAGVNLPARRVMITSHYDFSNNIIDKIAYRQMIGRAGRKGIDTLGESFIFCKPKELTSIRNFILTKMAPIQSHLITMKVKNDESSSSSGQTKSDLEEESADSEDDVYPKIIMDDCIIRTILEVISNGLAKRLHEIKTYLNCTFFVKNSSSATTSGDILFDENICQRTIQKVLNVLIKNNFIFDYKILCKEKDKPIELDDQIKINITSLGQAVVASGISPSDGLFIFNELERCREKLCLLNDLHLVYQTTPTYVAAQLPRIDWKNYMNIMGKMDTAGKKVANLINIEESFIFSQIMGFNVKIQSKTMLIHQRFYASLALFDLINEVPVTKVQEKFKLNKGFLQSLQQQASTFAGMLTTFCNRLGWSSLELLIDQFQPRISFGVQRELIDLVRIPCLNSNIARQLYSRGFDTVVSLIHCKPIDIEILLFNCAKALTYESEISATNLPFIKVYIPSMDKYLTLRELSKMIIEESRALVESDIGQHIDFEEFDLSSQELMARKEEKNFEIIDVSVSESSITSEKTLKRVKTELNLDESMEDIQTDLLEHTVKSLSIVQTESVPSLVKSESSEQTAQSSKVTDKPQSPVTDTTLKSNKKSESIIDLIEELNHFTSTPKSKSRISNEFGESLNADMEISSIINKSQTQSNNDKYDDLDEILDLLMDDDFSQSNNKTADPPVDKTNKSLSTLSIDADEQLLFSNSKSGLNEPKPVELSRNQSVSPLNKIEDPLLDKLNDLENFFNDSQKLFTKQSQMSIKNNENKLTKQLVENDNDLNKYLASSCEELFNDDKAGQDKLDSESQNITKTSPLPADSMDSINNVEMLSSTVSIPFDSYSTEEISQDVVGTFFKLLSANGKFTEENQLPMIQEKQFSMKDYSLSYIDNDKQCQKFLDKIFGSKKSSPITVGINICLEPAKLDDFLVFKKAKRSRSKSVTRNKDETIPMKHSTLTVASVFISVLDHDQVYCIKSSALYYLRDNWFKYLNQNVQTSFNSFHVNSQSLDLSSGSSLKQWRFISYDIKLTLKCLYDAFQFDRSFLFYNIEWLDFSVALWLLDPEMKPFDLEKNSATDIAKLAIKYNMDVEYFNPFCGKILSVEKSLNKNDTETALKTMMLFNLVHGFLTRLHEQNLYLSYCLIEIPARICLFIMETNPTLIDLKYMDRLEDNLLGYMENIETKIFSIVGYSFKLSSPDQVARVLYSQCNLISNYFNVSSSQKMVKNTQNTKTRTLKGDSLPKHLSTNKAALMKLQQACGNQTFLPQMIMDWRRLNHAVTNTIHTVRHFLRSEENSQTVLYCNCSEWTATGRITMSDPNLIGFDKDFEMKTSMCCSNDSMTQFVDKSDKLETKDKDIIEIQLRKIIISDKNSQLVTADYCQLELRILAHFSKDDRLSKVLNFVDKDVFKSIASDWKQIPYEQVDYESRQQAKQICYGIIYGMGDTTLAERLGVTKDEASEYKKTFFQQYPKLMRFIDDCVASCKKLGYVETISGRRRYLPNIKSEDRGDFQRACRQAVNTKIQGSAADILKIAMLSVQKQIDQKCIKAKFVLQMHDEIMFQVENDHFQQFIHCLKKQMENISNFINVLLPVKVSYGLNWSQMNEYQFN